MCTHDNLAKNYQLINKLGSSYKTTLQRLVKAAFKCVEGPGSKELKSKSTVVGLWDGLTHHTYVCLKELNTYVCLKELNAHNPATQAEKIQWRSQPSKSSPDSTQLTEWQHTTVRVM